jgi:hypothetical protein
MKTKTPNKMDKPKKIREIITLTDEQKNEWAQMYETKRKFPMNVVPCSVTGQAVVMFADNLHARVIKFGSARALLDNFVCREVQQERLQATKAILATEKAQRKADREAKREEKILAMQTKQLEKKTLKAAKKAEEKPKATVKKTKQSNTAEVTA